jgi:hypothetical protein
MSTRRYRLSLTAVGMVALAGCGGGQDADPPDPSTRPADLTSTEPVSTDNASSSGRASEQAPGSTTGSGNSRDPLKGRKAVPHPGGGLFYPPVWPRTTKIPRPTGCASNDVGEPRPPRPGFEAMRTGPSTIRVRIVVGRLPASCMPTHIRLTFDVNDDPGPPSPPNSGFLTPVGEFTPWYDAHPRSTPEAVDVAGATAVMSNGESGKSARVRIVDG